MKIKIRSGHSFVLLLAFFLLAIFRPPVHHYALRDWLTVDGQGRTFLQEGVDSAAECQQGLTESRAWQRLTCPDCELLAERCVTELSRAQLDWLSNARLDVASGRLRDTVVVFRAGPPASGAACLAIASNRAVDHQPMACYGPGEYRIRPAVGTDDSVGLRNAGFVGLAAALAAFAVCWWLVRYEHLHAHLSHDQTSGGPQKFHAVPTPRVGGLAVMGGLLLAQGLLMWLAPGAAQRLQGWLLLASLPAFLGGLMEDLTKEVGVTQRLLLTMASGAVGAWLFGAVLNRLAIPWVDDAFAIAPIAIAITVIAAAGLANALNIIDGYNGLASGTSVIVFLGLAGLAAKVGDLQILTLCVITAGAIAGFLVWNWPGGRIFLGDGGAYLIGFLMAELSVLLVTRSPSVSPWCAMMLMAHPVTETLFSIYRRQWHSGRAPGKPDALHLHQLIYSRLVRLGVGSKDPAAKLRRNSLVALYFWPPALGMALLLQFYWASSRYPVGFTLIYAICYVVFYRKLVGWRAPTVLILRDRRRG